MSKGEKNEGIRIDGGNLTAKNVAAGTGAVASSSDLIVGNPESFSELRELLKGSDLSEDDKEAATDAVDQLEVEAKAKEPDKSKVDAALKRLESLGKASAALFPLADRLMPLLRKISGFFF